jgi:mannose-6-phosphate isomerase-like protein (cupin superfamily)
MLPNLFPLSQLQEYIFGGNDTIDEDMPFKADIEDLTLKNTDYRRVLYTTPNLQLVLMSLLPGEEIGFESHHNRTQFFRIEAGDGVIVVNDKKYIVTDGDVVVVPPDTEHNVMNISDTDRLQLYTIYSPPEHPRGTVQKVKPKKTY